MTTGTVIGVVAAVLIMFLVMVLIYMYFMKGETPDKVIEKELVKPIADMSIGGSTNNVESFVQPSISILKSSKIEPFKPFEEADKFNFSEFNTFQMDITIEILNNGISGFDTVDAVKITFIREIDPIDTSGNNQEKVIDDIFLIVCLLYTSDAADE